MLFLANQRSLLERPITLSNPDGLGWMRYDWPNTVSTESGAFLSKRQYAVQLALKHPHLSGSYAFAALNQGLIWNRHLKLFHSLAC